MTISLFMHNFTFQREYFILMYFKFQCLMYCGYFTNLHTSMCNVHSVYGTQRCAHLHTHKKCTSSMLLTASGKSPSSTANCLQCTSSKLFKKSTIKCTLSKLIKHPSSTANCQYSVHHQNYLKSHQ